MKVFHSTALNADSLPFAGETLESSLKSQPSTGCLLLDERQVFSTYKEVMCVAKLPPLYFVHSLIVV